MKTKKLPQAIAELKKYKELTGMSYAKLSAQIGIDANRLSDWITGRVQPQDSSLRKVIEFLSNPYPQNPNAGSIKYIDSRLVAKFIGVPHKDLLKEIRKYTSHFKKIQDEKVERKSSPYLKDSNDGIFNVNNYFIKSSYKNPQNGAILPCYLVTELGCEFIQHKKVGVRGSAFTALYINEFHRLRNEAETIQAPQEAPQIEQESLFDNVPKTEDERDLAYLKQRLLDEMAKSTNVTDLGCNIVETLQIIQLLDKNKNKHK